MAFLCFLLRFLFSGSLLVNILIIKEAEMYKEKTLATQLPLALLSFLKKHKAVKEVTVPAGSAICQAGDRCDSLVIVLQGSVKVFRPDATGRSLTLYHVYANESCILTASCIINEMPFPAYAETTTDVLGLVVPPALVRQWLKDEFLWQQYILSMLSNRMADLIELVNALAFHGLDTRLTTWLKEQLNSGNSTLIQTTHQRIADDLASSREVISRLLKDFEGRGLIRLGRGTIEVLDLGGLDRL